MKINGRLLLYVVVMWVPLHYYVMHAPYALICNYNNLVMSLCSSDRDGTDSSEVTGIDHVISPTQVASTRSSENEALVAGQLPVTISLEKVGDTDLYVCVSKQICRRKYKYIKC